MQKKLISFISFIYLIFFAINTVRAGKFIEESLITESNSNTRLFGDQTGLGYQSPVIFLSQLITVFLSLLGVIFIILIILAGYNWMTAGGEEEKVNKAKQMIYRAIIGLIIIMSAYAITYFVFTNLPAGTSGGGSFTTN